MCHLVMEGDMSPSAARVAEEAGVSMRTVFRHFEDMDTLYREMAAIVEAEIRPLAEQTLAGATWNERLQHLLERRTEIFERIMPFRISGSLRRFSSKYLMEDYTRFIRMERNTLRAVLPTRVTSDAVLFGALEMATGFQSWRRLRQDQKLSRRDAQEVIAFTVGCLLADL